MTHTEALIAAAQDLISRGEDASQLLETLAESLKDVERSAQGAESESVDRTDRKATRKALKETRAELRRLLGKVDTALASGSASLQLCPPVIDPKEILPPHVVEGFRAEFRAKQLAHAAASAGGAHAGGANAGGAPLSLEDFQQGLGLRTRGPVHNRDYKSMVHGQTRRPFRSFPGATSASSDEQVTSPGKRPVPGCRAAQSSLGELITGGAARGAP